MLLNLKWIQSSIIQNLYNQIFIHLSSEEVVKPEIIMNELKNETERNLMAELLFNKIDVNKNMVVDCLIRLEKNKIQTESNKLREQLKSNQIDSNMQNSLLEKINTLQKQKNDVKVKYDNLSKELKEVFRLSDIEGLSYEEISNKMNVPIGTVRSRLHRAREILLRIFNNKKYE